MTTKINSSNIANSGVSAGQYVNSVITVNPQGQVTAAVDGPLIPTISTIAVTSSDWTPLDDLNADTTLAYIKITGNYFQENCVVLFNNLVATTTNRLNFTKTTASSQSLSSVLDFASTSNLTVGMTVTGHSAIPSGTTISAISSSTRITLSNSLTSSIPTNSSITFSDNNQLIITAANIPTGIYNITVVNPQGGLATKVNAITFGPNPAWQTSAILPAQNQETSYNQQLTATDAVSYSLASGSILPGTLTLSSSGLLSGTLPQVSQNTTYTFNIIATDAQLQDSIRTFSLTVYRGPATADITPAVNGKTTWDFNVDGPLNLTTAGTWTITPTVSFYAMAKVWGAAGGGAANSAAGGGGGYAAGRVYFQNATAYAIVVGSGGQYSSTSSGGAGGTGAGNGGTGGNGSAISGAGGGGAGSGIFQPNTISQANAILIGGGGGGAGSSGYAGGAGGGTTGDNGIGWSDGSGVFFGTGATQSAVGAGSTANYTSEGDRGSAGSGMNGGSGGTGRNGTVSAPRGGGGAGGGGYFGGGGGSGGGGAAGSGGGSSGRVSTNTSLVTNTTIVDGQGILPGNDTDSIRNSSSGLGVINANGGAGQIYIFA